MDHAARLSPAPRPGTLESARLEGSLSRPVVAGLLIVCTAALAGACASPASSPGAEAEAATQETATAWSPLGSWSGRGSTQTESFLVEGSVVRVRWDARPQQTGLGMFKLTFNSAVSGRELAVVADQHGPGRGEAYIPEEPRPAYFIVESESLEWSFSADEGVAGTVTTKTTKDTN